MKTELKRYKNAHTPSGKQGGAGGSGGNNSSDADDDDTDEQESAGGDSDAASDSSPGREKRHEGTTRPPPEPDDTVHVDNGYCLDCDQILIDPDSYVSQIVIDMPLPVPTTVVALSQTVDGPAQVDETQQMCLGFKGQEPPQEGLDRGGSREGGRAAGRGLDRLTASLPRYGA